MVLRSKAIVVVAGVLLGMLLGLGGCSNGLPEGAAEAVLGSIDELDQPRIDRAGRAELLAEDIAGGVEEAWCVTMTFQCMMASLDYTTCADSRLVRRIDGEWEVIVVFTNEDESAWEARGCDLPPDIVGEP